MKGNEAGTQGNRQKKVCRGQDEMGRKGNGTKKEKFLQNLEGPAKGTNEEEQTKRNQRRGTKQRGTNKENHPPVSRGN